MKTVLLPVSAKGPVGPAADFAIALSQKQAGHIQVVHVRPLPPIVAGEGITVPGDYVTRMAEEGRQQGESARQSFDARMSADGIEVLDDLDGASTTVTAAWAEFDGVESQVIGEVGRSYDLIVLDRRDGTSGHDWKAAVEAGLFESGRPVVLAASDEAANAATDRVVIAWNGSTETARCIALARPILERASSVEVVSVEGGIVPGPSGDDVARHLQRNGIVATTTHLENRANVGAAILAHAKSYDADLLIKGAFTQSRLRQMIFGGATSHILDEATIPVFLAH